MKRILSLFSVLFLVTLVTFIMTDLAPSDSAEMYYLSKGITPSEEVLNETRHEMGLDKNIVVRYVDWLNDFVHGDLSLWTRCESTNVIKVTKYFKISDIFICCCFSFFDSFRNL